MASRSSGWTSTRPINDPFVGLLLELNWLTGRLIREYTFLLDPPEFAAKAAALPAIDKPFAAARSPADTRPPEEGGRPEHPGRAARNSCPHPRTAAPPMKSGVGKRWSEIARELRPDGVSLSRCCWGSSGANPDAFDRGNINRLKAGRSRYRTSTYWRRFRALRRGQRSSPSRQTGALTAGNSPPWQQTRPAERTGRRSRRPARSRRGLKTRLAFAAEPKDQLRVSKTELADAKPLPAPKRSDEDLIAKEKALRDANERLVTLERNVAEEKLLLLKSQTLARFLEQQSGAVTTPPSATPAAQPAPAPAAAAGGTGVAAQPPVPAAAAGVPATPPQTLAAPPMEVRPAAGVAQGESGEPAKVEPPSAVEPAKAMETPAPTPVVPPSPPEEPEFFEELGNPFVLAGSSGIIALLAAYWLIRRRRQGDGETPLVSSTLAPVNDSLEARSVFRSTGGQRA